eukprot:jgi/Galph1/3228/GphlegSOOS_G1925.1
MSKILFALLISFVTAHLASASCSNEVMTQMQNIFIQNFTQNRALAPLCLRGAFHDCWNGCNGALLLPEEISRSENVGLEPLKTYLDPFLSQFSCVSVADLINSCAVTAVKFLGGPDVPVFFGRIDTGVPDPNGLIPAATLNVQELIDAFQAIGFDSKDIVALSGAHCVGVCQGQPFCPGQNTTFGNHYYTQLLNGDIEGKLQTDLDLLQDNTMKSIVQQYASDQQQFFSDFTSVFSRYISRIQCNQTSSGPCPLASSSSGSSSGSSSTSPNAAPAEPSNSSNSPAEVPPSDGQPSTGDNPNFGLPGEGLPGFGNGFPYLIQLVAIFCFLTATTVVNAQCSPETISQMQDIFVQNFSQNQALAPMCLHSAFHDCWNGCNGALFLPEEIDRPENAGLPPLKPYLMPFTSQFPCISVADLINSCAVTALKFLGGPDVPVYYGRLDRNVPDPSGLIPEPTMSLSQLLGAFSAIGFDKEEVVTLSGAHSVGVCHGVPLCPGHNTSFGNHYYQELIEGDFEGKLHTDVELLEDNTMRSLVQQYANDNQQFFDDFSRVLGKYISRIHCNQTSTGPCPLTDIGVSTSTSSAPPPTEPSSAPSSDVFPSSGSESFPEFPFSGDSSGPVILALSVLCLSILVSVSAECSSETISQMQDIFVQNFSQNQALAPMCLHSAFHDCWNGCNGALFLPEEIDRPENAGLPPLKPYLMPFTSQFPCISVADLINSCAVTALKFLGGPDVPVYYGRLDRNVPDPSGLIPEPTMSLSQLLGAFSAIGFDKEEVVTLSGAHSVGVCHGVPLCPGHNTSFGNHYYQELIEGDFEGKLNTDIELLEDNTMRSLVQQYANDNQQFFDDFSRVLGKYISRIHCNQTSTGPCPLTDIGVSTSTSNPSTPSTSSSSPVIVGSPIIVSQSSGQSSSSSFAPVPPVSSPVSGLNAPSANSGPVVNEGPVQTSIGTASSSFP